ncbi:MAG: TonB-dependent receptor plug domain-containing protein [Bacteroidetes bacterium]|nr:TonB-dependent receptor plug domain-containing protein [Bacteroidota bacterium]
MYIKIFHRILTMLILVFSISVSMIPLAVKSQICSDVTLNDARKSYDLGKFSDVFQSLNHCIQKGFNEKQKVEAYRLLAMSYLAIDSSLKAAVEINYLLQINPTYEANLFDPPTFIRLVNSQKLAGGVQVVTSVSKKEENIYEAAATIIIVTRKDIENRGYNDLIELLKDVPGFDLTMFYGPEYTNVYQRGFRQNNTEKTLLLIDGIEENDLWTNWAYIDRQYPLSNIERVEIIYGPASTMYGPNAFAGVINVITRNSADAIKPGKSIGISASVNYGTYNTQTVDLSVSGKKRNIAFTVTGRFYHSDEMDISSQSFFDYNPDVYNGVNYNKLLDMSAGAKQYLIANKLPFSNPYYTVSADSSQLSLTPLGAETARNLDKSGYDQIVKGHKIGFSNETKSWLLNGKLKIGNFTVGFQTWKYWRGGLTQFIDTYVAGSDNGFSWIPQLSYFFAKYENQISEKVFFSNVTTYRIHAVSDDFTFVTVSNYARGNKKLADLVKNKTPDWITTYMYELSKQLRTEFKVIYRPVSRFDLVSGFEVRNSTLQGQYYSSLTATPEDSAVIIPSPKGGNEYNVWDLGAYSQGTFQAFRNFKITFGLRYDFNLVRTNDGFGSKVSPRLALVYSPGKFTFKAIYSSGIMNVSNWTKYSVVANRIGNPTLKTENIQNLELCAGFRLNKAFHADMEMYYDFIDNVVGTVKVGSSGLIQNQNIGKFRIMGIQANAIYQVESFSAYFNYTFCDPKQIYSETGEVDNRVGDISSHQFNIGANKEFFNQLNINLRLNFVGNRITGEGTTVPLNTGVFPSTAILNGAITYSNNKIVPGLALQLVCNNILNSTYFDPGTKAADGVNSPTGILQRGRHLLVTLAYDL